MTAAPAAPAAATVALASLLSMPVPVRAAGQVVAALELITADVQSPTTLAVAPGDPDRLFVSELAGRVRIIENGVLLEQPFLDITALVNSNPPERGLAGLDFHPQYQANGQFFVTYTNLDSDSVLARYTVSGDPGVADPGSAEILLTVPQPGSTHNVGWLGFGPDGYLWVGVGDGGHNTDGVHAQDLGSVLGKILRLDVNTDDFPADPNRNYGIPPDNPFAGGPQRPEIWAYGLRNPWRCSFDRDTGDLWIGDVGDGSREEIDYQPASSSGGENYGWNCMEGTICHAPATGCVCGAAGLVAPVHEYSHDVGACAVIGGFRYRGAAVPSLAGLYVFADLCAGKLSAYEPDGGKVIEVLSGLPPTYSIGEDAGGELYLLSPDAVHKIVFADCNGNQVADELDIDGLTSLDCNGNLVPDECEPDCNENSVADPCDISGGKSTDNNSNGVPDECDAAADLDGDGVVGIDDFLILLGTWGACSQPCPPTCLGDIDGDCSVGINDFLILLGGWT